MEAISRHARDIKFVMQAMWADALIFFIPFWILFLKLRFYLNICGDQHMHHNLVFLFLIAPAIVKLWSVLFWDVTWHRLPAGYDVLGQTVSPIFKGQVVVLGILKP